jgi:hypothetical protein
MPEICRSRSGGLTGSGHSRKMPADGRNTGPSLDQLAEALLAAARDPRLRAVSVGELNPTRSPGEPDAIPRFIPVITVALSAMASAE